MNLLSANNIFSDIFKWFANLSSKLPAIDYRTYFIVVVVMLIGIGVIVALTFLGSYRFKLMLACRKIIRYLSDVDAIDNDNFGDFTAQCFSSKAPSALRDCWVQYLGVRFGYPSDIVSEQNVYDKEVKRVREIRANVYIAIALILIAIFAFWGYGRLDGNDMGVIFLASLLLSGVIYLVLVILNRMLSNRCLDVFNNMQEDLDAKVVFQVEKSFATDSSPLADLSAIIDEIVARNTAKEIGFEFADEQTPIEELIAEAGDASDDKEDEDVMPDSDVKSDDVDIDVNDVKQEDESEAVTEDEPENVTIDDIMTEAEEISEEPKAEEPQTEEPKADEVGAEEPTEPVEELKEDVISDAHESEEKVDDDVIYGVIDGEIQDEPVSEQEFEPVDAVVEDEPVEVIIESEPEEIKADDVEEVEAEDVETVEAVNEETVSDVAVEEKTEEPTNEEQPVVEEEPADKEPAVEENQEEQNNSEEYNVEQNDGKSDVKSEPIGEQETAEITADSAEATEANEPKDEKPAVDIVDSAEDSEPEIRYVVDGPDDDDEIVKPAQLAKMHNLVDYMIAQNASPNVKMSIVNKLLASYKKFENSDEDQKIIVDCIEKLMADLQKNK